MMRPTLLLGALIAGVGAPLVSGGPSTPPSTCTGDSCLIGAGGIFVDGGLDISGPIPLVVGASSNLFQLALEKGSTASRSAALCLGPEIAVDGGRSCPFQMRYSTATRTAIFGEPIPGGSCIAGADGGSICPTGMTFEVDPAVFGAGASGFYNFIGGTAANQGLKYNNLNVLVMHGNGAAQKAMECNASVFIAGTKAITFATAFASTPVCTCTDTSGGAAGAPVACSTDSPSVSGFNAYGIGANVFSWCCLGAL